MAVDKKFFVDINLQGNALNNATIGSNSDMTKGGSFRFDGSRLEYYDGSSTQSVANLADIAAVTGGLILQGGYDAATNTPNIAGGTALKGFFWVVTEAGSFLGESVQVGDSIIAKVDNAGASIGDWLILQGNVVIATDTVDGIVRLATQTEVNAGTEGGAVVVTPATLQGKIDSQITPAIDSKLPLSGGTMSGSININGNTIENAGAVYTNNIISSINSEIYVLNDLKLSNGAKVTNVPTPTNGTDAANKDYVDTAASTAQSNAETFATNAAATAESNANSYTDGVAATKLDLAGGTMSGNIDMNGAFILNASIQNASLFSDLNAQNNKIIGLGAPTNGTDAVNKTYVDTQIAIQSFTSTYAALDWSLSGGVYNIAISHDIDTLSPKVSCYDSGNLVEFAVETSGSNTIILYSNIAPPASLRVGVSK